MRCAFFLPFVYRSSLKSVSRTPNGATSSKPETRSQPFLFTSCRRTDSCGGFTARRREISRPQPSADLPLPHAGVPAPSVPIPRAGIRTRLPVVPRALRQADCLQVVFRP
jgi:hypothetical protein